MHVDDIKRAAVEALEEIKARDITILDVRTMTSLFDYMIVATAESARQTKALARNVAEKLREMGVRPHGIEGEQTGDWVLVDLGEVIVHVMQPAVRAYYNLESLWGGRPPSPHPTTWRSTPGAEAPPPL
jgi:ribosome-associated protein